MVRQLRIDGPGVLHHVHNRGARRQAVFLDDRDRRSFLSLLAEALSRHDGELHAYCLMGNHFHLLLRTKDGSLDRIMQLAMSRFVRGFNERHGFDGPLFTDRYSSHPVTDDRYAIALFRYIHRNPADIPGVDIAAYRWSSLRAFLDPRQRPAWLKTDMGLAYFGGDRSAFAHFVLDDESHVNGVDHDRVALQSSGTDNSRQSALADDLAQLVALTSAISGYAEETLRGSAVGTPSPERALLCELATSLLVATPDDLAAALGCPDPDSLGSMARRSESLRSHRPHLDVVAAAVAAEWRRHRGERNRNVA